MEKKYYLRENGKNIPYTIEELKLKNLKKTTKIWVEGSPKWERLELIPELDSITNAIPPPTKKRWYLAPLLFLAVAGAGLGGWKLYEKYSTPKLVELNSEQLYNKYESSVVLIKHSFLYKIQLGDRMFYFRDFNRETGEINELKTFNELKNNPNVVWGTGFFINKTGDVITNRHVLKINPTAEEQNRILSRLRNDASAKTAEFRQAQYEIENRLRNIESTVQFSTLTPYEFEQLKGEYDQLKENLENIKLSAVIYEAITEIHSLPSNFVSKTSTEFGIFFNKDKSKDYKNYIKYKSTNTSDIPDVDLAIISPANSSDLSMRKFAPVDLSLLDSLDFKPRKINDKVRMIGFNKGSAMAETSTGINSQLTEGNISQVNDENKILYSIPALPGSSGSPVFDKYGRLISVNFAGIANTQSFNFGIQTKKIQEFLTMNNKIKPSLISEK